MFFIKHLFHHYKNKDLWLLLFLGISSGIPFLLILSTYSYWLNELGFCVATISLFTLVSLPYSFKALWAPFFETTKIPFLSIYFGQKKAWGFLSQVFLCLSIYAMGTINPMHFPYLSAAIATLVCFFSAAQDIVIDGLRIDRFHDHQNGIASSFSAVGFHLGKLCSGCGTLYIAYWFDWFTAYKIMVLGIIPGMIALLSFSDITNTDSKKMPTTFKEPFLTLLSYPKLKWIILFIVFFKISDAVLQGTCATFFYHIGLDKIEFANLTKAYGSVWIIVGAILGGLLIEFFGIYASTLMAASVQSFACLLLAIQAHIKYDPVVLPISVAVENFSSGLVICTLIAVISKFVDKRYSMSHYTLLYAFGSFSRVIVSSASGFFAEQFGWVFLYLSLSFLFIPIVYFVHKLKES